MRLCYIMMLIEIICFKANKALWKSLQKSKTEQARLAPIYRVLPPLLLLRGVGVIHDYYAPVYHHSHG